MLLEKLKQYLSANANKALQTAFETAKMPETLFPWSIFCSAWQNLNDNVSDMLKDAGVSEKNLKIAIKKKYKNPSQTSEKF